MNKYQEALNTVKEKYKTTKYWVADTNEELIAMQELVNKATPKKVKIINYPYGFSGDYLFIDTPHCPGCHKPLLNEDTLRKHYLDKRKMLQLEIPFCCKCSQALDWSVKE